MAASKPGCTRGGRIDASTSSVRCAARSVGATLEAHVLRPRPCLMSRKLGIAQGDALGTWLPLDVTITHGTIVGESMGPWPPIGRGRLGGHLARLNATLDRSRCCSSAGRSAHQGGGRLTDCHFHAFVCLAAAVGQRHDSCFDRFGFCPGRSSGRARAGLRTLGRAPPSAGMQGVRPLGTYVTHAFASPTSITRRPLSNRFNPQSTTPALQ